MHRHYTGLIALLVVVGIWGATGCAQLKKQPDTGITSEKPAESQARTRSSARYQEPANSYYYFMMAEIQIRQGNMEQAVVYLEKAIQADPEAVDIKKELALVYIQQDKTGKALGLADEIIKQQPDNVEALIISASIRQAMGNTDGAKQAYEQVLAATPERKNIYLVLGRLYLQDEEYKKAVDVFSQMAKKFPDDYSGHFYLGQAYKATGQEELAIEAFNKTLFLQPGLLEPRVELIQIYTARKEPEKVIPLYEAILEQQPENIAARIELAILYIAHMRVTDARSMLAELGKQAETDRMVINTVIQNLVAQKRYPEALVVLEGMLDAAPANPDLQYLTGATKYLMNNTDEALVHLQAVGPESRFYTDAAIQQAGIFSQKNQPQKAIDVLESALDNLDESRSAEKVKLMKFLSAFYLENKDFGKAVALLNDGLAIDPDNTEFQYELGVVFDHMGDNRKAVEQMKTVLELDPENADALNYLGYTYADAGIKLEEAERLIRKALEKKPGNGYILDSMGWLYFKKGDYPEAVNYLEKAVEKVSDDPIILEHLGDAYAKNGQVEKALEVYERALSEKEDETTDLEDKIKRIKQP